jgi:hypothetical protein
MPSLTHIATSGVLTALCAAETDMVGFINSVASPALMAILPAPQ